MKKVLIMLFIVLVSDMYAISDLSKISILTCGKGEDLYSSFGHTAIRVVDEDTGLDMVFNYGTFDPSQDQFYRKFLNGTLMYFLSVSDFNQFCEDYSAEGREVVEQILNLSIDEKNIIWDKLSYEYLNENRYYRYNFVNNNCTTKVLDLINLINPIYASQPSCSFRESLNSVLEENKEMKLMLNLLMGSKADSLLELSKIDCFPCVFMNSLDKAHIKALEGTKPIVSDKRIVLHTTSPVKYFRYDILFLFIIIFIVISDIILLFRNYTLWNKYTKWMVSPIFLITGLLGLLIVFLEIVGFQLVNPNINILWCTPLNLILLPLLFVKSTKFRKYLILINIFNCFVYVILSLMSFQGVAPQFIIVMVLLITIYSIVLYGDYVHSLKK